MPLSAAANHAARTAFGTVMASMLTLWQPLRSLFSEEVQPLLPIAAVMAIFCAGKSLEEVIWCSAEGFLGTLGAVLNVVLLRWLMPLAYVPTDSWLALAVILEGPLFTAFTCLLPASESTKMYSVSLTAYFMMALFSKTELSVGQQCVEYLALASFGSVCAVLAYLAPLPCLADARGLKMAILAFGDVADGCAEVITEATAALLGRGAGEAWRLIARGRLAALLEQLADARRAVEYVEWAPGGFLWRLTRRGRARAEALRMQREAAFGAAAEAIDTCRLLCELATAAHAHGSRGGSVGAAAVQSAASACLVRVSERAAELIRDFACTFGQQVSGSRPAADLLGDDTHRKLKVSTRVALRNSSVAAKELLLLGLYSQDQDFGTRNQFATARSDMAAFLFLVHGLAADLLRAESAALRAAKHVERGLVPHPCVGDEEEEEEEEEEDDEQEWADVEEGHVDLEQHIRGGPSLVLLETPLLDGVRSRDIQTQRDSLHAKAVAKAGSAGRQHLRCWQSGVVSVRGCCRACTNQVWNSARLAIKQRWRIALKVSLSFLPAFAASVYLFNLDSTLVCSVAALSSYGSQYDGGSLRRSMSRAVGVAAGATFGSVMEQLFSKCFSQASWFADDNSALEVEGWAGTLHGLLYEGLALAAILTVIFGSTFAGLLLYYRGGQHYYAGFCAGFTAVKFLLCSSAGCINLSASINSNMYAGLLAVIVEMGILPIYAVDLLRARLAAALAGAAVALSWLVTSEVTEMDMDTSVVITAPEDVIAAAPAEAPEAEALTESQTQEAGLPDLTDRLIRAGVYDKYVSWRDGYLKWRAGDGRGAKGELNSETAKQGAPGAVAPDGPAGASPGPLCGDAAATAALAAATGALDRSLETVISDEVSEISGFDRQASQDSATKRGLAFTPAPLPGEMGATMEPIAGVPLPTLTAEAASGETPSGASHVILGEDRAFAEGMATFNATLLSDSAAGGEAQEDASAPAPPELLRLASKPAKLDPGTAAQMPHIAELLQHGPGEQQAVEPAAGPADVGVGAAEPATPLPPTRGRSVLWGTASGVAMPSPLPVALAEKGPTVSLAKVQALLDDIAAALVPAADLAAQATERLDSQRVDAHAWRRLAGVLAVVRLRLSLLARIALRLQHGVSVPELMGGEEAAATRLVAAFGGALAAAMAAVRLGTAPLPRTCAELEAGLGASSEALSRALARRRPPGRGTTRLPSSAEVTAEVLAGTAGHTLAALLGDAAELLALACALSSVAPGGAAAAGSAAGPWAPAHSRDAGRGEGPPAAGQGAGASLALPDLTERLKEAGKYEEYVKWRDGYMRWRAGAGHGAKGEIAENTTT